MAVACSNLTAGGDTDGGSSSSTASVTPTANALVLVTVTTRTNISTNPNEPTLSGNGLTYELVNSIVFDTASGSRKRVSVFRAMGASPTAGAITIDFAGQAQTDTLWSVNELTGVDTTGTNGSGAIVQSVTAKDESATSPTLTITLAAFASAGNATFAGMAADGNSPTVSSYGSGFTGGGFQNSANMGVASEFRADNDTSVDITWDGNHMLGGVAIEIKAAGGGVSVSPSPAAAVATVVAPTVILGSLTIAPAVAAAVAAVVNPTVVAGGAVTFSPATADAATSKVDPTVILGTLVLSPAVAAAVANSISPTVIHGSIQVSPDVAVAVAVTINPTVTIQNVVVAPAAAEVRAGGADPVVIHGSIVVAPSAAAAAGNTINPAVTVTDPGAPPQGRLFTGFIANVNTLMNR